MRVILVDKIPILKKCREFFGLEFGLVDLDETIHTLCLGISGDKHDYEHVHGMVYRDVWIQGHQESFSNDQKMRLFRFFWELRNSLVSQVHKEGRVSYNMSIRFMHEKASRMSLGFEILE